MLLHNFAKGKIESESSSLQRTWRRVAYVQASFALSLLVGGMTSLTSHLQLCQEFQGHGEIPTEFRRLKGNAPWDPFPVLSLTHRVTLLFPLLLGLFY